MEDSMLHKYDRDNLRGDLVKYVESLEAESHQLRKLLWLSHGCQLLYGDDGEMQCGQCRLDFKRDSIEAIKKRITLTPKEFVTIQKLKTQVEELRKVIDYLLRLDIKMDHCIECGQHHCFAHERDLKLAVDMGKKALSSTAPDNDPATCAPTGHT